MPHTLLLRLSGPMQAWGTQSQFTVRETHLEPTKSGIIGLLCAALGRSRCQPVDDLTRLRFGIRVDREGTLMKDFQTARNAYNASGKVLNQAVLSTRYYLANAVFLAGLESDDTHILRTLNAALHNPVWLLFLGRKAFPLSEPVFLPNGLCLDQTLESALAAYPRLTAPPPVWRGRDPLYPPLRTMVEDPDGNISQRDVPIDYGSRSFETRQIQVGRSEPAKYLAGEPCS